MWSIYVFLIFVQLKVVISKDDAYTTSNSIHVETEQKLSEYIIKVLDHFKEPDPIGIPGANIPDPYHVPDMKKSLPLGGMITFKNTALYGISKFRVLYVNVEASKMEATAALAIEKIHITGNYVYSTWLKTYPGKYTSDVKGLKTLATVTLGVDMDGKIKAQNISMDISFDHIEVQFENSGIITFVLQGLFNSLGTFLFESIKPFILIDAYKKVTEEIDKKLDEVTGDLQFPNSISPIDMILISLRNKIIAIEKDPYTYKDYQSTVSIFKVGLKHTKLLGISSFYRFGNITLKMENNTIILDLQISTQEIQGVTNWEISTFRELFSTIGSVTFTINYITVRVVLGQSLDIRQRPQFKDLDIELGNIQIRTDGAGTIDYIVELVVNILPNLLRNQIMKAFEDPIRSKVQKELNEIDVEELIKEFLPIVDHLQIKGLNLSKIFPVNKSQRYDEDDFFNF